MPIKKLSYPNAHLQYCKTLYPVVHTYISFTASCRHLFGAGYRKRHEHCDRERGVCVRESEREGVVCKQVRERNIVTGTMREWEERKHSLTGKRESNTIVGTESP